MKYNILNISKIGGGSSLNCSCPDIYNPLLLTNVSSKGFLFANYLAGGGYAY